MTTKICKQCLLSKPISEFYFRIKNDKTYYDSKCKECTIKNRTKYGKTYYANNKTERANYNKEYQASLSKEKKQKYRKKDLERKKLLYAAGKRPKSIWTKTEAGKKWLQNYRKQYRKLKKDSDPHYKLRANISRTISRSLQAHNSSKNGSSFLKNVKYTIKELKNHLENQFQSWMKWSNYGKYIAKTWNDNDSSTWTWQIDHIVPQSDLPYTSMEDENFQKCWDITNLRPLSSKENFRDGVSRVRHNLAK